MLSPTLVAVNWLRPKEINGRCVRYELHWQTDVTSWGIRQKGEQVVSEQSENQMTAYVQKLMPNETYSIWVRAYSETNETFNDSKNVQVRTFPEPDNITLVSKTPYSMLLQWKIEPHIQNCSVQYSEITSEEWQNASVNYLSNNSNVLSIQISDSKPKTQYKFRFVLKYSAHVENYIWPKDTRFVFESDGKCYTFLFN